MLPNLSTLPLRRADEAPTGTVSEVPVLPDKQFVLNSMLSSNHIGEGLTFTQLLETATYYDRPALAVGEKLLLANPAYKDDGTFNPRFLDNRAMSRNNLDAEFLPTRMTILTLKSRPSRTNALLTPFVYDVETYRDTKSAATLTQVYQLGFEFKGTPTLVQDYKLSSNWSQPWVYSLDDADSATKEDELVAIRKVLFPHIPEEHAFREDYFVFRYQPTFPDTTPPCFRQGQLPRYDSEKRECLDAP